MLGTQSTYSNQAAVTMGLPGVGEKTENAAKRFSSDILRIEITGPKQQHLSVVDVPGELIPFDHLASDILTSTIMDRLISPYDSVLSVPS